MGPVSPETAPMDWLPYLAGLFALAALFLLAIGALLRD